MSANGTVKIDIKIGGAYDGAKAVKAAGADLKKFGVDAEGTAVSVAASFEQTFLGIRSGAGAAIAKAGVMVAAFDAVAGKVKEFGEAIGEAAKRSDQLSILRRRIQGIDDIVAQASARTAGFFSQQEITVAAAKLDAFGIDAKRTGEVLEQVAKTSLRMGTDASHALESLVEGVSKLSAARLDNLGITKEAVESQESLAAAQGVGADQVERSAAVNATLSKSLDQLAEKNRTVGELQATQTSSLKRLERAWDGFWDGLKGGLADAAVGFVDWVTGTDRELNELERTVARVDEGAAQSLKRMRQSAERELGAVRREARETSGALRRLADLRRETGEGSEKTDAEKVASAEQEARDKTRQRVASEAIQLQRLVKTGQLDQAKADAQLATARSRVYRQERRRALERLETGEEASRRETRAQKDRLKAAKDEAEAIQQQRDAYESRAVGEFELRQNRKEIAALEKAAAGGVKAQAERTEKLNALRRKGLELERDIAKARGGGGGGGGARAEKAAAEARGVTILDHIRLEVALVKAAGKVAAERERELVALNAASAVERARLRLEEGRSTEQLFQLERTIAEVDAKGKLLRIEERIAAARKKPKPEKKPGLEGLVSDGTGRLDLDFALIEARAEAEREQIDELNAAGQLGDFEADKARGLSEAREIADKIKAFYSGIEEAATAAAASQDPVVAAFGRVTGAIEAQIDALTKGGASAISAAGAIGAAIFEDDQARWAVRSIAEAAAAAASFATGDIPGGIQHSVSSGLYAAAAASGGGSSSSASGARGGGSRLPQARALEREDRSGGGATIININRPVVGGTPQEVGAQLNRYIAEGAGTGRRAARV